MKNEFVGPILVVVGAAVLIGSLVAMGIGLGRQGERERLARGWIVCESGVENLDLTVAGPTRIWSGSCHWQDGPRATQEAFPVTVHVVD